MQDYDKDIEARDFQEFQKILEARIKSEPTPSIFKEQKTVDIKSGENAVLSLKGRHDPAIVHRAGAVINAVTALTLADLLAVRYGADWLRTGE